MKPLNIEHLSKRFGARTVIDDLSFSVPEHSVFGFLGQNGAGKTTTMKMALGLLAPDNGKIFIYGEPVRYGETRTNRNVGYLPDVPQFYGYKKPFEYLRLCGQITGMPDRKIKDKSEELLFLVGLDKVNQKIGGFSRGMKQRLGIAQALLNEPRLLICDEPTSALDPIGRKEILDILAAVKGKATVIFSTHVLSDVERICDCIAVLNNGKLALSGTLSEIKTAHGQDGLVIEFFTEADMARFISFSQITALLSHSETKGSSIVIRTKDIQSAEFEIISVLASERLLPLRLEVLEPTLESLFLEATK